MSTSSNDEEHRDGDDPPSASDLAPGDPGPSGEAPEPASTLSGDDEDAASPEPAAPHDPPTDAITLGNTGLAKLLERARDDAELGFEDLVAAEQDHVFSESYYLTGSVATATALSRDVFLRLFVGLSGSSEMSESDDAARRWLDRIVLNVVLHHFDRERARSLRSESSPLASNPTTKPNELPRPEPVDSTDADPDRWTNYDRLDDRGRAALMLRERHRLDYREIADALDTTIGSVKSILVDARCLALGTGTPATTGPEQTLAAASLSLCYDDEGPRFLRREVESSGRKDDQVRSLLESYRELSIDLSELPTLRAPSSILEEVRDRIRDETRPLPPADRTDLVDTAELTLERRSQPLRAILVLLILTATLVWLASAVLRRFFDE